MSEIIKNHKDLAEVIKEKRVLHMNSLGKDSAVCLEWLHSFAKPSHVVAVYFEYKARHYGDLKYLNYQKSKYREFQFITEPNPIELSKVVRGDFQTPTRILTELNKLEYSEFDIMKHAEEIARIFECDFICTGMSKYESVSRATKFHKKGILQGNMIYPLGMMKKSEIINIIKYFKIKLHPSYKFNPSGIDKPSYYKMRSSFIANPEYKKRVYEVYPLLALDEYRYEVLFKRERKNEEKK